MENLASRFRESAAGVVTVSVDSEALAQLDDDRLLWANEQISVHRRHLDLYAAAIAGELALRSRRELGFAGLAQRKGFISPEALVQSLSQLSRAEASKLVRIGSLLSVGAQTGSSADRFPAAPPWQASLLAAVSAASLSTDAADAIRRGLGDVDSAVTGAALALASEVLVIEAESLTVDQLLRTARQRRTELDADSVARREKQQRDDRSVKRWIRSDGMYALSGVLDPESGRVIFAALDDVLSPRRGGPRFVDSTDLGRADPFLADPLLADPLLADPILADPRTDEQATADALVAMVSLAVDADPGTLFGGRRPAVRVLVSERAMRAESGRGYLEGTADAVAWETVSRHICEDGIVGVQFDDEGQCVNVGRERRLFTSRQRTGLAARDGGCRFPGCDRPPSWCEAHHIVNWHRDRGSTNIADGILLCRFHHLLVHNNAWQILRDGAAYWLKPPVSEDPLQILRPMPSRSPALAELLTRRLVV
jgi:hypothetical protein